MKPNIPVDDTVRFLGVFLDPGLTWSEHVTRLSDKLSRVIYLLRNLAHSVSVEVLLTAYHAYFGSNMLYGIIVWGHSTQASKIFKLQRRCIRAMMGLGYRECCRRFFGELRLLTFPSAFIFQCLLYIKRNIHLFTQHREIHNYATRNNENILPDFRRLTRTRRGTDYYCVMFFNALPLAVRQLEEILFIKKIKQYLILKSFYSIREYLTDDFIDL